MDHLLYFSLGKNSFFELYIGKTYKCYIQIVFLDEI